ncbi:hypothetical protein Dsin_005318 [Dipteronia sinensis]|uniref:Uncharacterized protein n=1 Tax=Dipteronia sinensis TaxID=43782 RepID=A0AAE0EEK6_9ROSI|nr:hypothetical protein Dsin_005318 [Dipteronia sinensis]
MPNHDKVDNTYAPSIGNFVHQVCKLARDKGAKHQTRCLRASSLQCLSAMVWFMAEFSCVFADLDEVVESGGKKIEVAMMTKDDGLKQLEEAEIDAIVTEIESEKAAVEAAKKGQRKET